MPPVTTVNVPLSCAVIRALVRNRESAVTDIALIPKNIELTSMKSMKNRKLFLFIFISFLFCF